MLVPVCLAVQDKAQVFGTASADHSCPMSHSPHSQPYVSALPTSLQLPQIARSLWPADLCLVYLLSPDTIPAPPLLLCGWHPVPVTPPPKSVLWPPGLPRSQQEAFSGAFLSHNLQSSPPRFLSAHHPPRSDSPGRGSGTRRWHPTHDLCCA